MDFAQSKEDKRRIALPCRRPGHVDGRLELRDRAMSTVQPVFLKARR